MEHLSGSPGMSLEAMAPASKAVAVAREEGGLGEPPNV
jgi:hypothetical protein